MTEEISELQKEDETVKERNVDSKAAHNHEAGEIIKIEEDEKKRIDANDLKEQADQQLALISEGTVSVSMELPENDNSRGRTTETEAQQQLKHASAAKSTEAHQADTFPTQVELRIQRGHTMASSPNRDSANPLKVIEVGRFNKSGQK